LGRRVWVLGFGFWGLGFGFWGLGLRVKGFGFRVSGFEFRVWGFEFRVSGLKVRGVPARSGCSRSRCFCWACTSTLVPVWGCGFGVQRSGLRDRGAGF